MISGTALTVIAVDATCIHEIVHGQVNGILAKPGDSKGTADRIITLLDNPTKARMMGMAGRTFTEAHDIQRTWSLHEKLYQETVKTAQAQHVFKKRQGLGKRELVKSRIGFK